MNSFEAGKYINQGHYKSFQPNLINKSWKLSDMKTQVLLDKANQLVGKLDMFSNYIPNIDLFIRMHVLKEATTSSKIEGTKTNIEEALLSKDEISKEKRDDWEEVQNYISALNFALDEIKNIPFSTRLIKEIHKELMKGVRGDHKTPGEFRRSQNWIGGATLNDAIFIPPTHNTVSDLMGDLEKYAHNTNDFFPEILKIALIHYQFETIHPFLDGNGRTGRLIIPLYLVEKGIIKKPVLYLSDFFEKNRTHYYDNLMRVREKNDIHQWFIFFLTGFIQTCEKGIEAFDKIFNLQKQTDEKIQKLGSRALNISKIVESLYYSPIIDAKHVRKVTGLSMPSVYTHLEILVNESILSVINLGTRETKYVFAEYVNIFLD